MSEEFYKVFCEDRRILGIVTDSELPNEGKFLVTDNRLVQRLEDRIVALEEIVEMLREFLIV